MKRGKIIFLKKAINNKKIIVIKNEELFNILNIFNQTYDKKRGVFSDKRKYL